MRTELVSIFKCKISCFVVLFLFPEEKVIQKPKFYNVKEKPM